MKGQKGMIVVKEGVILGARWNNECVVLSCENGSVLCHLKTNGLRTVHGLYLDGKWFNGNNRDAQLIDLATGLADKTTKLPLQSFPLEWCASSTATPRLWISMNGRCVDPASGQNLAYGEGKAPCSVGTIVSEGMIVTPSA